MTAVDLQTANNIVNLVGSIVTLGLAATSAWAQRHGNQEVTGVVIYVCAEHVGLQPGSGDAEVIPFPRSDIEAVKAA